MTEQDFDDPHSQQVLQAAAVALARALGEMAARDWWQRQHGGDDDDDGGHLREKEQRARTRR